MEAVAYSTFRANLRGYIDKARDDAEPVLVTSKDPESNVVVINVRDWDNLMENLHVASNPYLYDKIRRGAAEIRAGKAQAHELLPDDDD